ncbi:hypothetical protein BH09BAC3_BH09BAC3_29130 [soil metagenome]
MRAFQFLLTFLVVVSCNNKKESYTILGNIEDPQNQIAVTVASILNQHIDDSLQVIRGVGSMANLDSLEKGLADFGIVDNYARFSDRVYTVVPLYPQVLHILYKSRNHPVSLQELFSLGKIFAGTPESGTYRFVHELMNDLGIDKDACTFVDVFNFFEADVIFSFTDLLTLEELRDLAGYRLFSIDDVAKLGQGSVVEAICARHPQLEPYIISRSQYGSFTETAILTLKVDAVLVCRSDIDPNFIYNVVKILAENSQELKKINPLLYKFSSDFDPITQNFVIHQGTRDFLNRHEPSFFERYAELLGVLVTIFVALASSLFTIAKWQQSKKKSKVDVYYQKLMTIRKNARESVSYQSLLELKAQLQAMQEETVDLVTREKLAADESFLIYLSLFKIVDDELRLSISSLSEHQMKDH